MPTGKPEQFSVTSPAESGDKIDRIRDLLLGGSLDELTSRLSVLETQLQSVESSLRDDIERRFTGMDGGVSLRMSEREAAEVALRQQLTDEVDALRREMSNMRVELDATMKEALAQLDTDKVDRAALSRLFSDISVRLQGGASSAGPKRTVNG